MAVGDRPRRASANIWLQGAQQSVNRALGEAQLAGEVNDAEPVGSAGEQAEDRRGAFDGLDVAWHRR